MPKGANGGKGGKGGGVPFAILGLDDASDTGISNSDDLTRLATGFTLTGTIDPSVGSFTLVIAGQEFTVDASMIDASGNWSFTYTGDALDDGSILVEAYYTTVHPKNGKTQTKTAEPYSFELDTQIVAPTIDSATDDGSGGVLLTGTAEAGATVTLERDGSVVGTAIADASGNWTFTDTAYPGGAVTYTATAEDAAGNVSTASAPLGYGDAGNTPPTAVDDAAVTDEDTSVTIDVLANDSDAEGDTLTLVAVEDPANGTAQIVGNTILYTPDPDFSGSEVAFRYTVSDGTDTSTAWVSVTVNPVNDPPVAADDAATTGEDTAVTIAVLANDTDVDGDTLAVASVGPAAHGTTVINADGTVTYTPDADWHGVDSFTYTVSDGQGGTDVATVTVTVDPVNDAPVAADDSASTAEDTAVAIDVLANDTDIDGDTLAVDSVGPGAHGTTVIDADGTVTYTPDADWHGVDSFTYTVSDGQGGVAQATVTVTVTPVNDPPEAGDDTAATERETPVVISVLLNDTDVDGDTLTIAAVGAATSGTVTDNGDGTLTYTPFAGFTGIDSFTYTVSDGQGGTDTATVTVTVTEPAADRFTPTDDLYPEQWHLADLGDMERLWFEFTGSSVHVGIYDDGIEYGHVDLDDNYVDITALGFADPAPTTADEAVHGTAVAGVIAAEANGLGTVGVAFDASISGVNIFTGADAVGQPGFDAAIASQDLFDVVNHSWGFIPTTGWYQNDTDPTVQAIVAGHVDAAVNGRGGLGTNVVIAAGNLADTSNGSYELTIRQTIVVAAHDSGGDASYYTARGPNILVSAPSSGYTAAGDLRVPTTDRAGGFGYVPEDWSNSTNGFGGTSSAAPTTSGVIALMLDANPGLGWRDVQDVLAYSARHIGGAIGVENPTTEVVPIDSDYDFTYDTTGVRPVEYDIWQFNGATNANGGGLHFSGDYGFGALDAYAAVRMAEVWSLFGPARTSANEAGASTGLHTPAASVAGFGDSVSYQFSFAGPAMELDYVDVSISLTAQLFEETRLELTSPSGTTITLMEPIVNDYAPAPFFFIFGFIDQTMTWTFGANAFRGEDPNGIWTVTLTEDDSTYDIDNYGVEASGITLNEITLDFWGDTAAISGVALEDDVYHYTDEVFAMLALEPGRVDLVDTIGADWLDMAAMTGDLDVDLASDGTGGASEATGGTFVAIAAGSVIENAVTGDGADTLRGNDAANTLSGMRGDDILWGRGGADSFVFKDGGGDDWIGDFSIAEGDMLVLWGTGYSDFAALSPAITQVGADTVILLGDADGDGIGAGDSVTLAGVTASDLTAAQFDFIA